MGQEERIVSPGAIRQMAERWPSARLMEVAGARHELMMEIPPLRQAFLESAIDHFLSGS